MKAITDGVVLTPSAFSITFAVLPYITATQELVVPRSMPMTTPVFFEEKAGRAKYLLTILIILSDDVDNYKYKTNIKILKLISNYLNYKYKIYRANSRIINIVFEKKKKQFLLEEENL